MQPESLRDPGIIFSIRVIRAIRGQTSSLFGADRCLTVTRSASTRDTAFVRVGSCKLNLDFLF
jgi:hypothetical protein